MNTKLKTFKRNLVLFKDQRMAAKTESSASDAYNPLDEAYKRQSVTDIPIFIIDHWVTFLNTYVPDNILGSVSIPKKAQLYKFEHALLEEYNRMLSDRSVFCNRDTFWKPSVEDREVIDGMFGYIIKLGGITIATIS